jgi:hypothetical protein
VICSLAGTVAWDFVELPTDRGELVLVAVRFVRRDIISAFDSDELFMKKRREPPRRQRADAQVGFASSIYCCTCGTMRRAMRSGGLHAAHPAGIQSGPLPTNTP